MADSVKPEDILKETENYADFDGIKIRKGTILAAIVNARLYIADRNNRAALEELLKLRADLRTLGLYDVLTWRDGELKVLLQSVED